MRILALLILISLTQFINAQDLSGYLSDRSQGKTDDYPSWLNHYANAEYFEAYKALKNIDADSTSYFNNFKKSTTLYQWDYATIEDVLINKSIIPKRYEFYKKFPEMTISLEDSTVVDLNKNLLKGVLMDRDSVTIMFDTGAGGVGISKKLVEKFQLKRDTSISTTSTLPAFDLTLEKHPVFIPKLQIGDMVLENINATYSDIDSEDKEKIVGPKFDLIIGLDIFINRVDEVTFDWASKKLVFQREATFTKGNPFLFFESKPFTSLKIKDKFLTTVIDTGAPTDIMYEEVYLKAYSTKEVKSYGNYNYFEYTINSTLPNNSNIIFKVGDYNNLQLKIGGEKVPVLIGNNKHLLRFNLKKNVFQIN